MNLTANVSNFVNSIVNYNYNYVILLAAIIVGLMFIKYLIALVKQIFLGGTKKVLHDFFYTAILGLITSYLISIL